MASVSDTDCSETPDMTSNEHTNTSNLHNMSASDLNSSPVHLTPAAKMSSAVAAVPASNRKAYNGSTGSTPTHASNKRRNDDDLPLSFASFYYSLKVLKAKGNQYPKN